MTLILKANLVFLLTVLITIVLFFSAPLAIAQSSLTLSVTPTKFDVRATPGQSWTSEIRIINSNQFDLVVFAEVVNFAAKGDGGDGQFLPIMSSVTNGQTLAEWVTVPSGEVRIAPEQSGVIPVTVTVPLDAPPGGHYAAVLISTQPPLAEQSDSKVKTAQAVTTLMFLRVAGDIAESGVIREFSTGSWIYRKPEVDFVVRFENRGNVHIQPRGDITILNMWGQERGVIPINQRSSFGDVLPEQIRRFDFGWVGEWSLADIGRYTAKVSVAYGEQGRQFATSETYFWVVPWHLVIGIIVGFGLFAVLIIWSIKQYIKRMLILSGVDPEAIALRSNKTRQVQSRISITAPLEAGMLDLRSRLKDSRSTYERVQSVGQFIATYRYFFTVCIAIVLFVLLVFSYISSATTPSRPYEIRLDHGGVMSTVSSDDLQLEQSVVVATSSALVIDPATTPPITIVNHSGVTGAAARLRVELESAGFTVTIDDTGLSAVEDRTFIVYGPTYKVSALALSQMLGNVLISAYAPADDEPSPITIFVGTDRLE